MSRTNPNDREALAVRTTCDYCSAAPDTWCRVTRRWYGANRPPDQRPYAPSLHWPRLAPVVQLWSKAYGEGATSVAEAIEYQITNNALGRWRLSTVEKVLERVRELRNLYHRDLE